MKYLIGFLNDTKGHFVKNENGSIDIANKKNKKNRFSVYIKEESDSHIAKTVPVDFTNVFNARIISGALKENDEVNINDTNLFTKRKTKKNNENSNY